MQHFSVIQSIDYPFFCFKKIASCYFFKCFTDTKFQDPFDIKNEKVYFFVHWITIQIFQKTYFTSTDLLYGKSVFLYPFYKGLPILFKNYKVYFL